MYTQSKYSIILLMKPVNLLRIHESAMRLEVLGVSSPRGTIKLLSRGGHKTGNFLFSVQIARDMDMFMNACKLATTTTTRMKRRHSGREILSVNPRYAEIAHHSALVLFVKMQIKESHLRCCFHVTAVTAAAEYNIK